MVKIIKAISFVIVITMWAIVGLYVWIPTLIVAMIVYIVGAMGTALIGNNELLSSANAMLEAASPIYSEGFRNIFAAIWLPSNSGSGSGGDSIFATLFMLIGVGGIWLVASTAVWYCLVKIIEKIIWLY